jgi:PAS domain S-box-containing protein
MERRVAIDGAGSFEAQQRLADALPILVMLSDADGVVRFFNRRWYEYTGQAPFERDTGNDWQGFMHPDDGEGVRSAWYDAVSNGERVVQMRYRLRHRDTGEYRWFTARAEAVADDAGRIVQWIGAAVDVHQEVDATQAVRRLLDAQTAVSERYQRAALPSALPRTPGLRFDAEYRASEDKLLVGGDWYDAFEIGDGQVAVSIGDVAGHGLDAALMMTALRQSGRAIALWGARYGWCEPAAVLDAMEQTLMLEQDELVATAVFGILDRTARTFTYASAGHPPPLLKHRDQTVLELPIGGTPLGCPAGTRPTHRVSVADACALVFYTDGVVEGSKDLERGIASLRDAVARLDLAAEPNAAAALLSTVGRTLDDDAAILVVHVTGP